MTSIRYTDLRSEYAALWASMVIDRLAKIDATARKILAAKTAYDVVQRQIGVPWYVVGIIHAMEAGLDFASHLHNGDPLTARTVQEPKGRPAAGAPPYKWEESAVDALRHDGLDKIRDWTIERIAHALEGYNGWRTRRIQGMSTPYLWSFSCHYSRGKYIRDNVWDPDAVSAQPGAMVLLRRLMDLDPSIRPPSDPAATAALSSPEPTDAPMSPPSSADWPLQSACNDFYGNPRGTNGQANPAWEKNNLVLVKAPWQLVLAWEPETRTSGIRVHRKCATSLGRILDVIWEAFGRDEAAIREAGLHLLGGGYNFRVMRGSNALSMHAWGCAVDFDPDRNSLGDKTPAMDRRVIEAFAAEGWEWGGAWSRPDGMHFQAARTSAKGQSLPKTGKPAARAPATPLPAGTAPGALPLSEEMLRYVQQRLWDLGYTLVGNVDGKWGPRTRDAILAYRQDYDLPAVTAVDPDFLVALARGKPRAIDPTRAGATLDQIAAKVPAVKALRLAKLWSWAQGLIGMVLAAAAGILDNITAATDKLAPLQAALGPVPLWLVVIGLAVTSFVIWRKLGAAEGEAADDYRQARRM